MTWRFYRATAQVPLPQSEQVGTSHAPAVLHAAGVYRWLGLLSLLLAVILAGCIPVTVRPERDQQGLPIAIPVTPTGTVTPEGELVPAYPVSDDPPAPPADWAAIIQQVIIAGISLLVGGGVGRVAAAPLINRLKAGVRIACDLADANASADTDEDVARNKRVAADLQRRAGVQALTQQLRGKPV